MPSSEKEPAYGYLRLIDVPDDEVEVLEKQLREYAHAHNLRLLDIHHDRGRGLSVGQVVAMLQRGGIQHLVVPSLEHVSSHPIVRMVFCEAVYLDAGAEVHEVLGEQDQSEHSD
ncbi:hypothetical protein [Streptomyces dysideae]|uniref:Resolvase/invertase-type recombinase catalytic domain-containing protein n=1 Tax=Streptomyces dysideae TaxID=909626 RepID=A0A117S0L7_9ACTN|nr:hypothetical protein [Streptomyces dysideae]KUO18816.1 hypothetical protein AQJ91_23425 [Streptomyces dysideae]